MRIGGVEIEGLNEDFIVLPRAKENIVIKAKAIADMDEFEKLCPPPKPPGRLEKGVGFVPNENNPTYKQELERYGQQRFGYLAIKSLEPSNIEWSQVDPNNPKTWIKWSDELKEGGLTNIEINHIIALVSEVNSLSEEKLKKARELFIHGQEEEANQSSSPSSEPESSPSGEPVSV